MVESLLVRAGLNGGKAETLGGVAPGSILRLLLELVECVFSSQRPKSALEVVNERAWCVGVVAVGAQAGTEGDVVVDGGVLLAGVGEVGFLGVLVWVEDLEG